MKTLLTVRNLVKTTAFTAVALGGIAINPAFAQMASNWLGTSESAYVSTSLNAGETVYGTCDGDCTDLDLFLYDSMGHLVSSDTAVDAVPQVSAPYAGTFAVEARMVTCYAEACIATVSSDYGIR